MLTRRWFLIGSSSFVAAAAIPAVPLIASPTDLPPPEVSRAVLSPMPYQKIFDLMFGFTDIPSGLDERRGCCTVRLFRGDEPIFDSWMHVWGSSRWLAMPGSEIVMSEDRGLKIEVGPDPGANLQVWMSFLDKERRPHFQNLSWRRGVLTSGEPMPINLSPPEPLTEEQIREANEAYRELYPDDGPVDDDDEEWLEVRN